jgi:release factor glutamine methyltransferase
MTILELLNWSTAHLERHRIENPRLNAELLLACSLKLSRERLYIQLNDQIRTNEQEVFEGLIKRRIVGEPLQYILGHQEFWSIDFKVDPRVLIPRPETELLVEQALSILSEMSSKKTPFVLELGTGSGAVAISLAKEVGDLLLIATDISRDALFAAKENARSAGVLGQIRFVLGNLFDPFRLFGEGGLFDLILSNPPYVERSEIERLPKEVRDYEPIIALDGGENGLEVCQAIVAQAPIYLKKGGWLLLEVGQGQGEKVAGQIERSGFFLKPEQLPDLSGVARVVKSQRRYKKTMPEIQRSVRA